MPPVLDYILSEIARLGNVPTSDKSGPTLRAG
jgi:hypothetical protein